MLSQYELSNIAAPCAGIDTINERDPQPANYIEPDFPEKVSCPKYHPVMSNEYALEFSVDEFSQCLELKYTEALAQGF